MGNHKSLMARHKSLTAHHHPELQSPTPKIDGLTRTTKGLRVRYVSSFERDPTDRGWGQLGLHGLSGRALDGISGLRAAFMTASLGREPPRWAASRTT